MMYAVALTLGLLAQAAPQRKPDDPHPDVSDQKVAEAIRDGVEYLRTSKSPGEGRFKDCDELILFTLIHAGMPEDDPKVRELLEKVLNRPLEHTYKVALLAMCLEELDRVKYQPRIYACAQFLIDNMSAGGRWSYGEPSDAANTASIPAAPRSVITGAARAGPPGDRAKPAVLRRLTVRKTKDTPGGDSSNTQYAALGLRACHDAGIVFPKDALEKAREAWLDTQVKAVKAAGPPATATGGRPVGDPRGWSYLPPHPNWPAYGSMTAGAIGSVCIYDYMLGRDWKRDKPVLDGLAWLDQNWSVTENLHHPYVAAGKNKPTIWLSYHLYAVERTGMLYYSTHIGSRDWYKDGALFLLKEQYQDGCWALSDKMDRVWDTCFAILFLKRATRPMVASGGKR